MTETPVTDSAIYTARPTVRVDGQGYALLDELLLGMSMVECDGGMASLELRFSDFASDSQGGADFAFEDDRILKLGGQIMVYAGDALGPQEIFRGTITGLELVFSRYDAPELTVLAEDAFQLARMTRRTKTHEDTTLSDLVNDFASSLNLTPVVNGLSSDSGTIVQFNESDLAFIRRHLAWQDADMQVVGTELHVAPRGDVERGTVTLQLYGQLREARVTADLSDQVTELTVSGWDVAQGSRITGTGTGANLGPGSGAEGKSILENAIGARSHHLGHLAAQTQSEAQALADAAFDQRARRFLRVEGTAEGNPQIRVGTHVELTGLGDRFSNTYYVTRACHRYDLANGYETDFEAECAYWGGQ